MLYFPKKKINYGIYLYKPKLGIVADSLMLVYYINKEKDYAASANHDR
jgi:hypothetical protein